QIKIILAHPEARQAGCNQLEDCAVRIEPAQDLRATYSKHRDLYLLRPDRAVCKEVQHNLGAFSGKEVRPEVVKLVDRLSGRAGTGASLLRGETVPNHQCAQRAGRGTAQADQFEPPLILILLLFDVAEDFGEDADRESSLHSAALTTDGDFFRFARFFLLGIAHCSSCAPCVRSTGFPPGTALQGQRTRR